MYLFTVLEAELSKIKVLESSKSFLSVLCHSRSKHIVQLQKDSGRGTEGEKSERREMKERRERRTERMHKKKLVNSHDNY